MSAVRFAPTAEHLRALVVARESFAPRAFERTLENILTEVYHMGQGVELAEAFRSYQAALDDRSYWDSEEARERNKQQVGAAFDRLVQLTNTILGDV